MIHQAWDLAFLMHNGVVLACYCANSVPTLLISWQGSSSESVAKARRLRRQRKLDRTEIPADHVVVTEEVLGKGGFGAVFLADYNGRNAAAKVGHTAVYRCGTVWNASNLRPLLDLPPF